MPPRSPFLSSLVTSRSEGQGGQVVTGLQRDPQAALGPTGRTGPHWPHDPTGYTGPHWPHWAHRSHWPHWVLLGPIGHTGPRWPHDPTGHTAHLHFCTRPPKLRELLNGSSSSQAGRTPGGQAGTAHSRGRAHMGTYPGRWAVSADASMGPSCSHQWSRTCVEGGRIADTSEFPLRPTCLCLTGFRVIAHGHGVASTPAGKARGGRGQPGATDNVVSGGVPLGGSECSPLGIMQKHETHGAPSPAQGGPLQTNPPTSSHTPPTIRCESSCTPPFPVLRVTSVRDTAR